MGQIFLISLKFTFFRTFSLFEQNIKREDKLINVDISVFGKTYQDFVSLKFMAQVRIVVKTIMDSLVLQGTVSHRAHKSGPS